MYIACISTITKKTTEDIPSGQEGWIAKFVIEEVKRKHKIDLFAVQGSLNQQNKINLIPIINDAFDDLKKTSYFIKYEDKEIRYFFGAVYSKVLLQIYKNQAQYDLVIDNSNFPPLPPAAGQFDIPYIVVVHTPGDRKYVSFFKYFSFPHNLYYIFPSRFEYKKATMIPEKNKFYIPHGIRLENVEYKNGDKKNLLWYGRIDSRLPKGAIEALTVSNKLKRHINFYYRSEDNIYFESEIRPLFSKYTLLSANTNKSQYFDDAKLFIFAGSDKELFGLVLLEAMATGTPVICYARGAAPEIVVDGVTGYVINSSDSDKRGDWVIKKTGIEGLAEAVERIYSMPQSEYEQMRKNARKHVEEKFTIERMVDEYEKVYEKIIASK